MVQRVEKVVPFVPILPFRAVKYPFLVLNLAKLAKFNLVVIAAYFFLQSLEKWYKQ